MQFRIVISLIIVLIGNSTQTSASIDDALRMPPPAHQAPTQEKPAKQIDLSTVNPNNCAISGQMFPSTVWYRFVRFMDDASVRSMMTTCQKAMAAIVVFGFDLPENKEQNSSYVLAEKCFAGIIFPEAFQGLSRFYLETHHRIFSFLNNKDGWILRSLARREKTPTTCLLPSIDLRDMGKFLSVSLESNGFFDPETIIQMRSMNSSVISEYALKLFVRRQVTSYVKPRITSGWHKDTKGKWQLSQSRELTDAENALDTSASDRREQLELLAINGSIIADDLLARELSMKQSTAADLIAELASSIPQTIMVWSNVRLLHASMLLTANPNQLFAMASAGVPEYQMSFIINRFALKTPHFHSHQQFSYEDLRRIRHNGVGDTHILAINTDTDENELALYIKLGWAGIMELLMHRSEVEDYRHLASIITRTF